MLLLLIGRLSDYKICLNRTSQQVSTRSILRATPKLSPILVYYTWKGTLLCVLSFVASIARSIDTMWIAFNRAQNYIYLLTYLNLIPGECDARALHSERSRLQLSAFRISHVVTPPADTSYLSQLLSRELCDKSSFSIWIKLKCMQLSKTTYSVSWTVESSKMIVWLTVLD